MKNIWRVSEEFKVQTFSLLFRMKFLFSLLLLLTTTVYSQINPSNITIARDSFGVPHIFAPTDPEVAYGIAWAHAEDDFGTLQTVVQSGKGMLGKALGKKRSRG